MPNRREFLAFAGGVVGGMALTSCGGGAGGEGVSVPNGYRFYRLINRGDALPQGRTINALPGSAMISEANTVIFHAIDDQGAMGCYELTLDYGSYRPKIVSLRKVVKVGDTLPDGHVVVRMRPGDINEAGSYAGTLKLESGNHSAVYLDRKGHGLERVVGCMDATPGVDGKFDHTMGDVDLHDDDDLLCVAHYNDRASGLPRSGIFHLPTGVLGKSSALVVSSGDLLPDATGSVQSFGLIDRNDGGHYVAQTTANLGAQGMGATATPIRGTALLGGTIGARGASHIISGSSKIRTSPTAGMGAVRATTGEIYLGPRLGTQGDVAHVVHTADEAMTLYYQGQPLLSTGDRTPRGNEILTLSPAVVSDDGLVYFSTFGNSGIELCVASGGQISTILGSGDLMPNDPRLTMDAFVFGAMNKQVDAKGRLVLIGDYNLAQTPIHAVVIGLPV